MKANEKAIISAKDYGSNKNLTSDLTMRHSNNNQNIFQYKCSFCWRELPNNSIRFKGIGACPLHFEIARKLIEGLREHAANYRRNLGVRK
jgi:hypothetical protein